MPQININDAAPSRSKKRIFLNGFDMFTPSHLSFGQWRRPEDKSATKRRDLSYWTNLAQLLDKGDINALFLADTYGQHDTYKGSAETTIAKTVQYPMGDPAVVRGLDHVHNYLREQILMSWICSLSLQWPR